MISHNDKTQSIQTYIKKKKSRSTRFLPAELTTAKNITAPNFIAYVTDVVNGQFNIQSSMIYAWRSN